MKKNKTHVKSSRRGVSKSLLDERMTEVEQKSLVFRRSIYVASDIAEGELFSESNLRIVRPGDGAPPWLLDILLGRKARKSYSKGTPLSLDQLL